jgi:hypothetical protein
MLGLKPTPGTPTQLEAILAHPELAAVAAGITLVAAAAVVLMGNSRR